MNETRDSVLYLVDASLSMARCSALDSVLSSICEAIRETARQGVAQYDAGVVLFNTDTPEGTRTLLSMGEPGIGDIKKFNRVVKNLHTEAIASAESSGSALLSALRVAKSSLNSLHTKSYRRVVLITNDDEPFAGEDSNSAAVATTLISDLVASPALITPLFINPAKSHPKFNTTKFWIGVEYTPSFWGGTEEPQLEPIDVSLLNSRRAALVISRSVRKFTTLRGTLKLSKLRIGVLGYSIVRSRGLPTALKIGLSEGKNGFEMKELLKSKPILAKAESGAEIPVEKSDQAELSRMFKLSSSKDLDSWGVPVDEKDLEELKNCGGNEKLPGIQIEKFVPVSRAIDLHNRYGFISHSLLIVPNDHNLTNSTGAFESLHRSMRNKKLVAVGLLRHSPASPPQRGILYAFSPVEGDPRDNKRVEVLPSADMGLYFVPLPFIEDTRESGSVGEYETENVSEDIVRQARLALKSSVSALVRRFNMPMGFDPTRFPNPALARFAYILEHTALSLALEYHEDGAGRKIVIEPKDDTKPRYGKINEMCSQIGSVITEQLNFFGQCEPPPKPVVTQRKRNSDQASATKRVKLEHGDINMESIKHAITNKELVKWTVPKLKIAAKLIGHTGDPIPSRKNELINYIECYFPV